MSRKMQFTDHDRRVIVETLRSVSVKLNDELIIEAIDPETQRKQKAHPALSIYRPTALYRKDLDRLIARFEENLYLDVPAPPTARKKKRK